MRIFNCVDYKIKWRALTPRAVLPEGQPVKGRLFHVKQRKMEIINMSYDINFWKYQEETYLDNGEVYRLACDGETVQGLEELPIEEIRKKVMEQFSDWDCLGPNDYEKPGRGAFQLFTTPQFVRFDCCGVSGDDMNRLVDIMLAFGCPLYDPQVGTRFDGVN